MLIKDIEYALEEQLGMIQALFNIDNVNRDFKNISVQEYEISTLIKNRVDSFRVVSRSMGVELRYQELAKGKINVAKEVLFRVLDNLISNGLKYSPRGNILIKLEGIDSSFKISVIDDGIGLDSELRANVFSSKIRSSKEVPNMGNRYGLTVVKKLIEEAGGIVGYSPNQVKGSTFWFNLPAVTMYNNFQDRYSAYSILLIDDDLIMRKTHSKWLEVSKYSVKSISSFFEARQIIDIETPKLIIADVNIPGEELMDFLEFLPADASVIILSGRPEKIVRAEYGSAPQVKRILEKPASKSELLDSISEILGNRLHQVIEKAA
jgi:CheY-like chemotaxis protein